MTVSAAAWFGAAVVAFAINLGAVITISPRLEAVTKPAVMVFLIAAALTIRPHVEAQRWLFVAGLLLGLVGDVLLLPQLDRLVPSIAFFGAGHLAYITGFVLSGLSVIWTAAGLALILVTGALLLPPILRGLRAAGRERLMGPVAGYAIVISGFMASAAGSGRPLGVLGALLFYASDGLLGWYRFVGPLRWGRPVNIVLYQTGQALLVGSLAA